MAGSRHAKMSLDFEEYDKENPRTFSTQKKVLVAFHALLSAFAAYVPYLPTDSLVSANIDGIKKHHPSSNLYR